MKKDKLKPWWVAGSRIRMNGWLHQITRVELRSGENWPKPRWVYHYKLIRPLHSDSITPIKIEGAGGWFVVDYAHQWAELQLNGVKRFMAML